MVIVNHQHHPLVGSDHDSQSLIKVVAVVIVKLYERSGVGGDRNLKKPKKNQIFLNPITREGGRRW